jgi:rhodanese-related sulfurtransferase
MPGYRDLLTQAKRNIREVDPAEAEEHFGDTTFLDVRELDEYEQGAVPDAVFIPRGHLESQVENKVPKDKPVVVYCAAGNRSAFAAETLQELGYGDVASM